jgi:hypothetical protein
MIVANLATYPARESTLVSVIESIIHQVDVLQIVLNQYHSIPRHLEPYHDKIRYYLPKFDMKDVGKFLPSVHDAEFVALIDDDIVYPDDYIQTCIDRMLDLDLGSAVVGYHGTIYRRPPFTYQDLFDINSVRNQFTFRRRWQKDSRRVFHFMWPVERSLVVDQLGTGTVLLRAEQLPPLDYMLTSRRFVDVRFARWCYEKGSPMVCLERPERWFKQIEYSDTIFRSFTSMYPESVAQEICRFAMHPPRSGLILD